MLRETRSAGHTGQCIDLTHGAAAGRKPRAALEQPDAILLATLIFNSGALKVIFGNLTMPLIVLATGSGVALVLALVSGLPPAWRARQLNIVDALAGR